MGSHFKKLFGLLFIAISIISFWSIRGVQAEGSPVEELVNISNIPETPGPFTTTTVNIESYATDLTRAEITWSRNGKVELRGIGKTEFVFKTGAIGTRTDIVLTIKKSEGGVIVKNLTYRPGEVDLLWESDSYIPPLYKGKGLHTAENSVTILALPNIIENGVRVPASSLVYEWSKDGKKLLDQSGVGKSVLKIQGPGAFGESIIQLVVSTIGKGSLASKNVTISTSNPKVVLYEERPLYGPRYEQSLYGTLPLLGDEATVWAEPYYVNNTAKNRGVLKATWTVGGVTRPTVDPFIVLRQETGSGLVDVRYEITHPTISAQRSVGSFSVSYNKTKK